MKHVMAGAICALVYSLMLGASSAQAGGACGAGSEENCMLEAIWAAAAVLPQEKQRRLTGPFLEMVEQGGDPALLQHWTTRLQPSATRAYKPSPYARLKAEAVLAEGDWDNFLQKARAGTPPFNIGRPEIMGAGARLAQDPALRRRITEAMFELAGGAPNTGRGMDQAFEQADFGYVLAELSMEACDAAAFDRAVRLTNAPDSIRYALWRSRITGKAGLLVGRISDEADPSDTRHVRAAIEGYAPVLARGYCR